MKLIRRNGLMSFRNYEKILLMKEKLIKEQKLRRLKNKLTGKQETGGSKQCDRRTC